MQSRLRICAPIQRRRLWESLLVTRNGGSVSRYNNVSRCSLSKKFPSSSASSFSNYEFCRLSSSSSSAPQPTSTKPPLSKPFSSAVASSCVEEEYEANSLGGTNLEAELEKLSNQRLSEMMDQEFGTLTNGAMEPDPNSRPSSSSSSSSPLEESDYKNYQVATRNRVTALHELDISTILKTFSDNGTVSPSPELKSDKAALQLWLECNAQRDTVYRTQSTVESALKRKDYTSLTTVQTYLVRWFDKLRDTIEERQKLMLMNEKVYALHLTENDCRDGKKKREIKGYSMKYHFCLLQPEKLAILAAHVALTETLSQGRVRVASLAVDIGESVEAEVNVQRLLHERIYNREKGVNSLKSEFSEASDGVDSNGSIDTSSAAVNEIANGDSGSGSTYHQKHDLATAAINATIQQTGINGVNGINGINGVHTEPNGTSDDESAHLNDDWGEMNPDSYWNMLRVHSNWMYTASHLEKFTDEANYNKLGRKKGRLRAQIANRRALSLMSNPTPWPDVTKAHVGAGLLDIIIACCTMENGEAVFRHEKRWENFKQSKYYITLNPSFHKAIVEDKYESLAPYAHRPKPMVLPPKPWMAPNEGGYTILKTEMMRTHGNKLQREVLRDGDLSQIYKGLDVLGKIPWKVCPEVLKVVNQCWDDGVALGDIPGRKEPVLPPVPVAPKRFTKEEMENETPEETQKRKKEYFEYRKQLVKYNRIQQEIRDLYSQRCSALLKINQANQFVEEEVIYFPYSLDFRGRAYPIPPHFSNIGSDLCRGLLRFAEPKALGERGLYWLKVHLANLAGNDKISFDDRAAYAEEHMEDIFDSADRPLEGKRWWMTCDDPFQALATCIEIKNAIQSGDSASFKSSLPVHMDGSCNGLQHYAALGRDKVGGKAVNLCRADRPEDVYSGVMEKVRKTVASDAKKTHPYADLSAEEIKELDLPKKELNALYDIQSAKMVDGLIDRGVVKRTVMTSVYGVTFVGAKQQIKEKIEEKLLEKGVDIFENEKEIHQASAYLARITISVMGELFQGARQTMNWLTACARIISATGTPMSWLTPLGLPVVQPYRKVKNFQIVTLLQRLSLVNNTATSLPVNKSRQVTAFPPNYVHSLDASHMLLTAMEMSRRGLAFSAVHDSFWTHAADVDTMNTVLRECFVDLYDAPLLEDLLKTWELRYPGVVFPSLPKRGDLELSEVKDAPYFFQ